MTDDQARDGWGRYATSLEGAERDAAATRLYRELRNYQKVADQLGYSSKGDAWRAVQRCKREVKQQAGEELIAAEASLLDELYTAALEVLERDHITVSQGRVVKDDDGVPIPDDGPKLAAIRELRGVRESYRRLFGLDAATKSEANVTVNPHDIELAEIIRRTEAANEAREALIKGEDQQ